MALPKDNTVFSSLPQASGLDLDRMAQNMGLKRNLGEGDESFRTRMKAQASGKAFPMEVFTSGDRMLGEMRLPRKGKQRVKHDGVPILHLWVPRPPKQSRGKPRLKILSIFSCSNEEIQNAIADGAAIFQKDPIAAERFQNLCFTELQRRIDRAGNP